MSKDPAALVYIDKWIAATNGMKAEFRAWYFDLLLYQFDNGSVPNDFDEMAGICRVRPSEIERFNQFVDQVVDQKFNQVVDQNQTKRLENSFAKEVITKRKSYKKGKDRSSAMGVVVRYALKLEGITQQKIKTLKEKLYNLTTEEIIELKNIENLKDYVDQVVDQKVDLLINVIEDVDIIKDKIINEVNWIKKVCKNIKEVDANFNEDIFKNYLQQFFKQLENDGETSKSLADTKKHFSRWLNIQIKKNLNVNGKQKQAPNWEQINNAVDNMFGKQK